MAMQFVRMKNPLGNYDPNLAFDDSVDPKDVQI